MAKQAFGSNANGGGGGAERTNNIVDLKSRDKHHLRLMTREKEMWQQYTLRQGNDPNSQTVRFVVQKPGDILSIKGFRTSRRYAVNVWNYDTGKVEILIGGPQIFQTFDAWAESGIDILSADIMISRSGTGRDTAYTVIRMDSSEFMENVGEGDLHDTSVFDNPPTDQELVGILEEMEIDIDSVTLDVPSLDQAKAMEMPFGKHRGLSLEEVYNEDIGYVEWFLNASEEQGNTGRDIYIALKVIATDGAYNPNDSDKLGGVPPQESKPKAPKKRAKDDDLSEDELRDKIKEALTGPDWSDFSKVIALFEEHTEPTKHDVSKCSADELNALWNAVR